MLIPTDGFTKRILETLCKDEQREGTSAVPTYTLSKMTSRCYNMRCTHCLQAN